MKVLQVTHYMPPHPGGIERVVAALADGLRARGHEVHWIASATPASASFDSRTTRVRAWNLSEERLGVPFPVWGPSAFRALRARVAWADVVHAHDCLYMGTSAAVTACRRIRRPLLVTQHVGYVPFGPFLDLVQGAAYRLLGLRNLAAANALVACSPHVAEHFKALGCARSFQIIPNAVAVERFAPARPEERAAWRRRLGLPLDARVVLFVGRLVPKKGVPRVVAAQRALARDGSILLVVGDGPLAPFLGGVPGTVHIQHVDPEDMPGLYAAADLFLLPSRGEGFPVSAQEAMLSGLSMVVSDDPAFTSNLSNAPGVFIAQDDPGLVTGVRRLLAAPSSPEAVSAWARHRWTTDRFLGAYERVLSGLARRTAEPG